MNSPCRLPIRFPVGAIVLAGTLFLPHGCIRSSDAETKGPDGKSTARSGAKADPKAPKDSNARVVPVLVAPVEKRDVPLWLEGLGSAAAWQQVTVRAQVDGRLDKVFFREGQVVRRGDLLAQIDPRAFTNQLHQANGALVRDRAQLAAGSANLGRYRTLRAQGLVAQQQVDDQAALVGQLEGTVGIDEATADVARLNLDYARIRAPIDGVVGVRLVDAGNVVRATDPTGLVLITQLDPAAVLFTLPQDELPRITAAQKRGDVRVEAWSRDGLTLLGAGTLAVVDNQINQTTATLKLKALVPNVERKLWPNQFVKARLLVDVARAALIVPSAAVQRGPQGTFVYVVDAESKAQLRPVEIALVTADLTIVTKGVGVGEQVVIEGQNQLRPGASVTARPAKDAGGKDAAPRKEDKGPREGGGKKGTSP